MSSPPPEVPRAPPPADRAAPRRIANARMYAVTPEVEALWRGLLARVTGAAGVELDYVPYPLPQPLERLWARADLGAVLMCGFPIATQLAPVVPIAAPIPSAPWAAGRPVYRSDLVVRADAPYRSLEDTFGGRAGWTVSHSHSGFNAWRHHLLAYRSAQRPRLYAQVHGDLVGTRSILASVLAGEIDVGPLDAYWHQLLARYAPERTAGVRVLATTAVAPMPAFVAAAGTPPQIVERLRAAFTAAAGADWFSPYAEGLMLRGFAPVTPESYAVLLEWERAALEAGYPLPA